MVTKTITSFSQFAKTNKDKLHSRFRGTLPTPSITVFDSKKALALWPTLNDWQLAKELTYLIKNGTTPVKVAVSHAFGEYINDRYPGLDGRFLLRSWFDSFYHYPRFWRLSTYANLLWLRHLEEANPGNAKYLANNFGINIFARYPLPILLNQCHHEKKGTLPVVLLMSLQRSDHNGAAYWFGHFAGLSLWLQSRNRFTIKVIESETFGEAVKHLNTLHNLYGPISAAVVEGHASKDAIYLSLIKNSSGKPIWRQLRVRDIKRPGFKTIGKFFVEEPSISLASCSTGLEDGIAQTFSSLGARVDGPSKPSNICWIWVKQQKGKIILIPWYWGFALNIRRTYFNGSLIYK